VTKSMETRFQDHLKETIVGSNKGKIVSGMDVTIFKKKEIPSAARIMKTTAVALT
jgi:hypothetical protein